jgi:hypothetical protein
MAAFVVRMGFNKSLWPFILVLLILVSRILSTQEMPGAYSIYIYFVFLLFVFAGVALILKTPYVLNTQAKAFFIISLPIMLLQIAGAAESLQIFNTLYITRDPSGNLVQPEINLLPLLFTPDSVLRTDYPSDYFNYLSMQSRPSGITHSSAMFGVFIVGGAAVYLGQLNDRRLKLTDAFVVSVVVFSGSKLSLLCFMLIFFLSFLRKRGIIRTRLISIFFLLILIFLIYYLIFPGPMEHNYQMGAFAHSFIIRFSDAAVLFFPSLSSSSYFLEIVHAYPKLFMNVNVERGSLSGIYKLFQLLPFVLIIFIVVFPLVRKGFRMCMEINPSLSNVSKLMLMVIFIIPFASNVFTSPFYGLCVGVAIAPLILGCSHREDNYYKKMS